MIKKLEKLREALNNTVDIRNLCNTAILLISQQLDDLITQYYREQEGKSKDMK